MTRRERIAETLQAYSSIVFGKGAAIGASAFSNQFDALVEALLTCWPEPSREALQKILDRHLVRTNGCHHKVAGKCGCQGNFETFRSDLLSWARGEPERPTWCVHWKSTHPGIWLWSGDVLGYSTPSLPDAHWKVCPYCATPRPTEG